MIVKDVVELSVKDAVAIRFKEICDQRGFVQMNLLSVPVLRHLPFTVCSIPPDIVFLSGRSKNSATALTCLLESFSPALCLMILSRRFNRSTYTPLIRFRQQPDRI